MQSSPKRAEPVEESRYNGEDKLLIFPNNVPSMNEESQQGDVEKSETEKPGSFRTLTSLPSWRKQPSNRTADDAAHHQDIQASSENSKRCSRVRFAKATPTVTFISPIETELEKEMRWYSKAELRTIRRETKAALDAIKAAEKGSGRRRARRRSITGSSAVSSSSTPPHQNQRKAWWHPGLSMFNLRKRSSSSALGAADDNDHNAEDDFTSRGLEHLLDPFMLSYRDVVWGNIVKAVLKEQMRQRAFGEVDGTDAIARVSSQCSKLSKYNARKLGLGDEMEVRQFAFLVRRSPPRRNSIGDIDIDVGLSSRSESDLAAITCDTPHRLNSSDSSILESHTDFLFNHFVDDSKSSKPSDIDEQEVTNVRPLSMRRTSLSRRYPANVAKTLPKTGISGNQETTRTGSSHRLTNSGQNEKNADLILNHIDDNHTLSTKSSRGDPEHEVTDVRPLSMRRRMSYPSRLRPAAMVRTGMEDQDTGTQKHTTTIMTCA